MRHDTTVILEYVYFCWQELLLTTTVGAERPQTLMPVPSCCATPANEAAFLSLPSNSGEVYYQQRGQNHTVHGGVLFDAFLMQAAIPGNIRLYAGGGCSWIDRPLS